MKEEKRPYLKVERTRRGEYKAFLTNDGTNIYNDSSYEVGVFNQKEATAKVSGEFVEDWDLKLEALMLMKWLEEL